MEVKEGIGKGIFADLKNSKEFLNSSKPKVFADLHIHSRFSRATSKALDFENLVKYAKIKGLGLMGTGDCTHPKWFEEMQELEERDGILYKDDFPFIISGEISLMYTQEKGRRIHYALLMPSMDVAEQFNKWIDTKGRRDYDGRPIFGFSSIELMDAILSISPDIEIIPAHIWTPWFGLFGSKTGFDSIKECFQEKEKHIHAIETGLSSDPEMNWKIKELNNRSILSNSDLHSFWPWRIGREATIFSKINNYKDLLKQIRNNEILGTIEVDPAYGKYHYDGHRLCEFSCGPEKTKELNGICPKCGKQLTVGVEYRVKELADQNIEENKNRKPFYKLLPLTELIALAKATSLATKKAWGVYNHILENLENEFNVLLNVKKEELLKVLPEDGKLVALILQNRLGNIKVKPGFDGVYGEALLGEKQATLS